MRLKVKTLNLDAGGKTIVIINSEDAREFGIHALERLVLRKGRKRLTTVVNVTDKFVEPGNIIVYNEVKEELSLKNDDIILAEPREELISKHFIRKKVNGYELSGKEIRAIVDDVIARNLNDLELSSFITALQIHGLSMNETVAMARAMIATGKRIKFHGVVVDKHSCGGVPGDKTTMLLVPIIATAGLTIPKTSSRAITDPAGTADRVEVLAPVNLDIDEIKRVVRKTNGCMIWGGSVNLAPADDLFIQIENPLSLDPLLLPSVMSKKKAVGARYIIIDIPCGLDAKSKTREDAEGLASSFITIGKKLDMKVECAITRANQPIGCAIGPALEAREALENLMLKKQSSDLIEKVTTLAGLLLKMVGKGNRQTAKKILFSRKAEKKFREIIEEQGGNPKVRPEDIPYAPYKKTIRSKHDGIVAGMSNRALINIARAAGAPKDKLAGILLNKKIKDRVKKGESLFTIYAEKTQKLKRAVKIAEEYRKSKIDIISIFDHVKKRILIEEI